MLAKYKRASVATIVVALITGLVVALAVGAALAADPTASPTASPTVVTKTCPPDPQNCSGTNGADVLKSTSQNNNMYGKGGNDTYTNFARGSSGHDYIGDSGGKDKLLLTNYSKSEVKPVALDKNENGKADSLGLFLAGKKNTVVILGYYDDTKSTGPFPPGPGYIEQITAPK